MIHIPCPSGFTFDCHPIGGQVFATVDEANAASGEQAIRRTFNACHASTEECGPYAFVLPGDAKPEWDKIHFSDLLVSMFRLRMGSFTQPRSELGTVNALGRPDDRPMGQVLEFELSCNAAGCGKLFESAIDLAEVLESATEWSDEMKVVMARGTFFETTTRGGDVIYWRPSTLSLNKPMAEAMRRIVGPTYGTRHRPENTVDLIVKHVTRIKTRDAAGKEKVIGPDVRSIHKWWMRPGNGEDIDLMLRELDERQPTVSNDVLLQCVHCGTEQRRAIPFGGTYFFPSTSPQAKRRRATARSKRLEESPPETSSGSSSPV